jgi:hypothetical protein
VNGAAGAVAEAAAALPDRTRGTGIDGAPPRAANAVAEQRESVRMSGIFMGASRRGRF